MQKRMSNTSVLSLLLLLFVFTCGVYSWEGNPVADPKAIVVSGNARFTILTSQLIRVEYSSLSSFRDNATLSILNRYLPVPSFSSSSQNGYTIIKTADLVLTYKENSGPFTSTNLNITLQLNGATVTWNVGSAPTGNLLGTVRTLDDQDGAVNLYCPTMNDEDIYDNHCTLGVISRDGWAVHDDSEGATWDNDPNWPWYAPTNNGSCNVSYDDRVDCNPGNGNQTDCELKGCCYSPVNDKDGIPWCYFHGPAESSYQDYYFFGYGHQYLQALQDFTKISGPIPTFPRYIFGPQYSRWHAFNEVDEVALIEDSYEALSIPLDVLVLDMDWHYTYSTGAPNCNPPVNGWTGYTWDKTLFPNPSRFLSWAHEKGLHITNNMHPAAGVQCSEDEYAVFAESMGVDPSTNNSIAYAIQDKKYSFNFMDLVLKPLSNQGGNGGIDYWWIDYQQGENSVAPGVNPTFWVNYVFATAQSWWGADTRPLIMARWGGLGNHRFSTIGFSGDVTTSWQSLAFQPYFTATASNVGFFWSHDLGGFNGQPDPELFVRWIQWGAFSNLLRTHCDGKQQGGGYTRDIWEYPAYYFEIMRSAFILRSHLVPYVYTHHALSYVTGIGLLRPMYYYFPEEDNAYNVPTQYFYGDSMLVSPVIQPNQGFNLTTQSLWVPPGVWLEYQSGQSFTGPQLVNRSYMLSEVPVLVPAGAIIPMRSEYDAPTIGSAQQIPSILRFDFFPQGSATTSETVVVEDDGVTTNYENGQNVTTPISFQSSPSTASITVQPAVGPGFNGMATQRAYQFNLVGVWPATSVQVNGNDIPFSDSPNSEFTETSWSYITSTLTLQINLPTPTPTSQSVTAKIVFSNSLEDSVLTSGYERKLNRLQACKDLLDNQWGTYYPSNYPNLLLATGSALNSNITTIYNTLHSFSSLYQKSIEDISSLSPNTNEKQVCLGFLNTA